MSTGLLDMIATPKQGNKLPADVTWCADNGCFSKGYPGDDAWFAWLESFTPEERARCLFAVAPDVVGDAVATETRSRPWLAKIRALGYPVAYVAQDGLEDLEMPGDDGGDWWDDFDVLFIGGSTEWKLGRHAINLAAEAKRRGKWVHMGRVNSERRLRYADAIGCDSADGTYIAFGPDLNLPTVLGWLRATNDQGALDFGGVA
jgi:hypothetical protein